MTDLFSQSSRQVQKNQHQVSLSICISLQRLFCRSTGSSLFVRWVFGVLTQNTSTNPREEIRLLGVCIFYENWTVSNIFISQTPNQKKNEKKKNYFCPLLAKARFGPSISKQKYVIERLFCFLCLLWIPDGRWGKSSQLPVLDPEPKAPSQWKHFLLVPQPPNRAAGEVAQHSHGPRFTPC